MSTDDAPTAKYLIPVVAKTLDVLEVFRTPQEELTLEQVISRTNIAHTTAYRILQTLLHRGYVSQHKVSKRYRLQRVRQKPRIGYATLGTNSSFSAAITRSLEQAANAAGIDLLVHDNQKSEQAAISNARAFVAGRVEVAIEFQRHEHVGPVIADIFREAAIPTIAILIPQPGAIYFGVDNYRAGLTAGLALGELAAGQWGGKVDLLLLLDLPLSGPVVQSRMTGVINGVGQKLGPLAPARIRRVDGKGLRRDSAEAATALLRRHPRARRLLVSAVNDESALGALDAVREAGLTATTAIIGHGGSSEVWPEITTAGSPFYGTTAFFPEAYGRGLINLVQQLLRGEQVAPYHYMPHELITRDNVARHRGQ